MEDDRAEADLDDAFRAILSTDEGKRVLFWVLEQANIYGDAYKGDDAATNYTLGQQSIGRRVLGLMNEISPRAYPALLLAVADDEAMARAAKEKENKDELAP